MDAAKDNGTNHLQVLQLCMRQSMLCRSLQL